MMCIDKHAHQDRLLDLLAAGVFSTAQGLVQYLWQQGLFALWKNWNNTSESHSGRAGLVLVGVFANNLLHGCRAPLAPENAFEPSANNCFDASRCFRNPEPANDPFTHVIDQHVHSAYVL